MSCQLAYQRLICSPFRLRSFGLGEKEWETECEDLGNLAMARLRLSHLSRSQLALHPLQRPPLHLSAFSVNKVRRIAHSQLLDTRRNSYLLDW